MKSHALPSRHVGTHGIHGIHAIAIRSGIGPTIPALPEGIRRTTRIVETAAARVADAAAVGVAEVVDHIVAADGRTPALRRAAAAAVRVAMPQPPQVTPATDLRLDKWLWCVRLFKTRTLATEACTTGRVHVNGQPAKPARSVRPGDTINADIAGVQRTFKVLALLPSRVGAKLVPQFLEDLTPAEEFAKTR